MRISDWSSDVCSSDLAVRNAVKRNAGRDQPDIRAGGVEDEDRRDEHDRKRPPEKARGHRAAMEHETDAPRDLPRAGRCEERDADGDGYAAPGEPRQVMAGRRSESDRPADRTSGG